MLTPFDDADKNTPQIQWLAAVLITVFHVLVYGLVFYAVYSIGKPVFHMAAEFWQEFRYSQGF